MLFLGLISPSPSTKSAKSVPSTRDIDSGMILCSQYSIVFSSVSNIQNYLIASILVFMSTNEKAKVDLGVVILSPFVCWEGETPNFIIETIIFMRRCMMEVFSSIYTISNRSYSPIPP